jgi:hypothetical protein
MTHYKNTVFERKRIHLDGDAFTRCEFRNCIIILERGDTKIEGCRFFDCKLMLQGNAYVIAKIITQVTGKKPLKVLDMHEPLFPEDPREV